MIQHILSRFRVPQVVLSLAGLAAWALPAVAEETYAEFGGAEIQEADPVYVASQPVAMQPGTGQPAAAPRPAPVPPPPQSSNQNRPSVTRIARVPNMFGDTYISGPSFSASGITSTSRGYHSPSASGGRVMIGENNKALTDDRIFFQYNHFENVASITNLTVGGADTENQSIDRYMVGMEKTFLDGLMSVELRVPLLSELDHTGPGIQLQSGTLADPVVILKLLLHADDDTAISCGVGTAIPLGENVTAKVDGASIAIHNDTVFLTPFFAVTQSLDNGLFGHLFTQLDIAPNVDRLIVDGVPVSHVVNQNFVRFDVSGGFWFYENEDADLISGLAGLVEIHYIHSITDGKENVFGGDTFVLGAEGQTFDFVNLTWGVHTEFANDSNFRVAASIPLNNEPSQNYDFEIMATFNKGF